VKSFLCLWGIYLALEILIHRKKIPHFTFLEIVKSLPKSLYLFKLQQQVLRDLVAPSSPTLFFFSFLVGLGFELRALHLLGRRPTTSVTPPTVCALVYFQIGSHTDAHVELAHNPLFMFPIVAGMTGTHHHIPLSLVGMGPGTAILLISASQVTRIIGLSIAPGWETITASISLLVGDQFKFLISSWSIYIYIYV
jgi:hypothetical protein